MRVSLAREARRNFLAINNNIDNFLLSLEADIRKLGLAKYRAKAKREGCDTEETNMNVNDHNEKMTARITKLNLYVIQLFELKMVNAWYNELRIKELKEFKKLTEEANKGKEFVPGENKHELQMKLDNFIRAMDSNTD